MSKASEAKKFVDGDMLVYPGHGVGKLISKVSKKIGGSEQSFFEILISETGMKVMVPIAQAEAVGLRTIINKGAVNKIYSIIKDRKAKVINQTWNRRHREYLSKIKTGSVYEIAEVIRDLIILSSGKELSFGEKKMMDLAQGLLVEEISVVKDRSHDKVRTEIESLCQ